MSPPSPIYRDIGHVTEAMTAGSMPDGTLLQSNEQDILQQIRQEIGSKQVSFGILE